MRRPAPSREEFSLANPKGGRPPKHGGGFVFGDPATWGTGQAVTVTDTRLERPGPAERRVLAAAARAATATGLSVATHAHMGAGGPAQLELLTDAGLPARRISTGHQDLLDAPAVHRTLAAVGAYVAFDTVGKETYASDGIRLRLLLALVEAGHADRVLLSGDVSRYGYLLAEGGQGYGHLFRSFLPKLRAAGADDDLIDLITRRNPLRFLTGTKPDDAGRSGSAGRADASATAAVPLSGEGVPWAPRACPRPELCLPTT